MTTDTQTLDSQIDIAIEAGSKFATVFYDTFVKKRHMINKLYHESAHLLWEGNSVTGHMKIQEYLQELPGSYFKLTAVDCQPVMPQYTQGKQTILVTAVGTVKFDGNDLRCFTENFMLISVDGVWKVISDSIRLHDP